MISAALDCLMCGDVPRAVQALMDRQSALMESQTPKMKDYDPREAPCRC